MAELVNSWFSFLMSPTDYMTGISNFCPKILRHVCPLNEFLIFRQNLEISTIVYLTHLILINVKPAAFVSGITFKCCLM